MASGEPDLEDVSFVWLMTIGLGKLGLVIPLLALARGGTLSIQHLRAFLAIDSRRSIDDARTSLNTSVNFLDTIRL